VCDHAVIIWGVEQPLGAVVAVHIMRKPASAFLLHSRGRESPCLQASQRTFPAPWVEQLF